MVSDLAYTEIDGSQNFIYLFIYFKLLFRPLLVLCLHELYFIICIPIMASDSDNPVIVGLDTLSFQATSTIVFKCSSLMVPRAR